MKKTLVLLFIFIIQSTWASEVFKIDLAKNEKLEGTFSMVTNKTESAHFLFVKNTVTDKYDIRPYFFSADKKVKALDAFSLDEMPEIVAKHTNENVVTLISYDEKKNILSVPAPATQVSDSAEQFKIDFAEQAGGADMILHWDTTQVIVPIR